MCSFVRGMGYLDRPYSGYFHYFYHQLSVMKINAIAEQLAPHRLML